MCQIQTVGWVSSQPTLNSRLHCQLDPLPRTRRLTWNSAFQHRTVHCFTTQAKNGKHVQTKSLLFPLQKPLSVQCLSSQRGYLKGRAMLSIPVPRTCLAVSKSPSSRLKIYQLTCTSKPSLEGKQGTMCVIKEAVCIYRMIQTEHILESRDFPIIYFFLPTLARNSTCLKSLVSCLVSPCMTLQLTVQLLPLPEGSPSASMTDHSG